MRSKFSNFWCEAELKEVALIRARRVLEEIALEEVSKDAKSIMTPWMYGLMSGHQGKAM
ncbi:hypothetical protein PC114_g16662 [Phytophthora cactorum]|nr:hypothetical protein PC114_g16662 [Phytophthora cactorum]